MTCTTQVPFPAVVLPGDNELKANQVYLTEQGAQGKSRTHNHTATD